MDLPPKIIFKGGIPVDNRIIPAARSLYLAAVSFCKLSNISSVYRNKLISGYFIQAYVYTDFSFGYKYGTVVVSYQVPKKEEILELYMESGYIDLLTSAICNIDSYKPGILNYNTVVSNYILSLNTPMQGSMTADLVGQQLVDGTTSLSVGCSKLSTSATDFCGTTHFDPDPIFCDTQEIIVKKTTQTRMPSSMFTGKMKLFVQSLYGSKRTDYKILINEGTRLPDPGVYKLLLDNFELVWDYPSTVGIFTTEDYKYFLLQINQSTIDIYNIDISEIGNKILKNLKIEPFITDKETVSKIEAYALSTATIDKESKVTINIGGGQGNTVSIGSGDPLAYGWKFNSTGTEARIVLHTSEFDTTNYAIATEYILNFEFTDGLFSATLTEGATGEHAHDANFVIWKPDWQQFEQFQYGAFSFQSYRNTNNCPIYGWYDELDVYKRFDLTVNINIVSDTPADPVTDTDYGSGSCGAPSDFDRLAHGPGTKGTVSVNELSFIKQTVSYEIDDKYVWRPYSVAPTSGPAVSSDSLQAGLYSKSMCTGGDVINYLIAQGYWEPQGPLFRSVAYFDFDRSPSLTGVVLLKTVDRNRISRINVNDYGKIAIVIPFRDSQSLSIIKDDTKDQDSKSVIVELMPKTVYSDLELVSVSYIGGGEHSFGPTTFTSSVQMGNDILSAGGGTVSTDNTNTKNYDSNFQAEGNIGWTGGLQKEKVKELSSTTEQDHNWTHNYVQGVIGEGLGGKTIITKSTYNGSTVIYHGELDVENPVDRGFIEHSGVGWV